MRELSIFCLTSQNLIFYKIQLARPRPLKKGLGELENFIENNTAFIEKDEQINLMKLLLTKDW